MDAHSQSAHILAYLREGHSLTPLEALNRFDCFRLGARIWDLKREGHDILTEMVEVNGKRVASYRLNEKRPVGEVHRAVPRSHETWVETFGL